MKVFFDTNVLLDIALAREPFVKASIAAWTMVAESDDIDVFYVILDQR